MRSKDTVFIQAEGGSLSVSPPVPYNGVQSPQPAELETDDQLFTLSPVDAELLARTIAPQLFPEDGTEPWRTPIRETYADLAETVQSYGRDLRASGEANWDAGALTQSLSGLLEALNGTLDRLEKLL
jgi:hypothetical protein